MEIRDGGSNQLNVGFFEHFNLIGLGDKSLNDGVLQEFSLQLILFGLLAELLIVGTLHTVSPGIQVDTLGLLGNGFSIAEQISVLEGNLGVQGVSLEGNAVEEDLFLTQDLRHEFQELVA